MKVIVVKRDGRRVDFDSVKIRKAIEMGFFSVRETPKASEIDEVLEDVVQRIENTNLTEISIETIQDFVEDSIKNNGFEDVYFSFSRYRKNRTRARANFQSRQHKLLKTLEGFGTSSAVDNNIKRENANINGDSAMGMMLQFGSTLSKDYTKSYLLDPVHTTAHDCGDIHIHDMDFYPMGTTTCLQIPLDKLFKDGFNTGHGFLREPKSIGSYAALAAIAIQSNQNDQHGGQSIPMFDYYLANGVLLSYKRNYKQAIQDSYSYCEVDDEREIEEICKCIDELTDIEEVIYGDRTELIHKAYEKALKRTDKDSYQAMEAFIHNLNTMHSRAGAQVPFSSINFGTDISEAGRMLTKNLLLAMESGLGNHETAIFPICIFKVKEGVNYNKEDKNYDLFELSCRVSAKRMFPNFAFIDAPFNKAYYKEGHPETEIAYMGCRTRVIGNVDKDHEVVVGRGNLSFTSINLPRIALRYGKLLHGHFDKEGFFEALDKEIDLVKEQLLSRFQFQCQKEVINFPFLMEQGAWLESEKLGLFDRVKDVLRHGTLTIGFIGLAECLKALILKHHGESDDAQALGLEIITFMREKCDIFCEQYKLNFSLIATPAEGLAGRFIGMDKDVFGEIEGVTDRDYYTNSFHIPVYYPINAYDKLAKEAPYHTLTNAGHISYVELDGDPTQNIDSFIKIVRMMKDLGIGYGAINHPIDRDPVCGFNGIINDTCPECGRSEENIPFERIRRITGYLVGTLDRFNDAKRSEEHDRVKHE